MPPLLEQLEQVAIARFGSLWWASVSPPRAVRDLLAKAYEEDWPRISFDSRVVLECARRLKTSHLGLRGEGIKVRLGLRGEGIEV